jgi:hypothetical protein
MPEFFPPPSGLEDSPDFTEDEAKAAEEAPDSQRMVSRIGNLCCGTCGKRLFAKEHALRRLGGVHYSRVKLECENDHQETRVFRLDWLKG